MRTAFKTTLLILAAGASAQVAATPMDGADLSRARNCVACHQTSGTVIGPGFAQIAMKYRGVANADALLGKKIREGGSGVWGAVPMPANLQATDEEARQLAKWILAK